MLREAVEHADRIADVAPIAQVAGLLTQYYQASSALNLLNKTVEAEQERENLKGWVSHTNLIGNIEFKNVI